MSWRKDCVDRLDEAGMFEDSMHKTRFKDMIDCYGSYPFFSRGLCKCIYLSAWDEEHFRIMLEMLSHMSVGKDKNTEEMRIRGADYAEETQKPDYYVYQLSNAFLDNAVYTLEDAEGAAEDVRYVIRRALEAAEIIDRTCQMK